MALSDCIKSTKNLNASDVSNVNDAYESYIETMDADSAAKLAIDDAISSVESEKTEYIDLFNETYPDALTDAGQNKDLSEKPVTPKEDKPNKKVDMPFKPQADSTKTQKDGIKKPKDDTGILFSQNGNEFSQVSEQINKKPKRSISADQLNQLVNKMQQNAPGTRLVKFHIRATQAEAFGEKSLKEHGIIQGGFYSGSDDIVLIAENIVDVNDAITVIRHELIGHYGLRQLLNKEGKYDKLLKRVYESRNDDLKESYDWVARLYPELIEKGDVRAIADEMLARAAETKTKSDLLTEIYDFIIKMLNKLGLVFDSISRSEVDSLIRSSSRNLRKSALASVRGYKPTTAYRVDDDTEFNKSEPGEKFNKIHENSKKSRSIINTWLKRNLTKEGLMNQTTFDIKLKSDAIKNVGEEEISYLIHNFEKSIYKSYGKSYNKLSDKELEGINEYLKGNKNTAIPNSVMNSADLMRKQLDVMSIEMLKSIRDLLFLKTDKLTDSQKEQYKIALSTNGEQGNVPEHIMGTLELMLKMLDNIGTYMTRSYQAFDDKNWKEKALSDTDLISETYDFILKNNPDLNENEVMGAIRAILQDAKDSGGFATLLSKGSKVGSKDVSITTKRKDVPEVIRKLLGEYKDPKLNFARSASKMQWYIANHHFLMNLREKGLGEFLFEIPTGEHDTLIATEGSEAMNPVSGLYATEEFRQGMEDAVNGFDGSELMRSLIRINSMVKYGKTILSPTTQARNFQSAAMFSIFNGHFNWLHAAKAFKVAKADLFTKDEKWKGYINDLIKLGVLHDNPYAGELKDAINDVTGLDVYKKGVFQSSKKFLNWMQKSYQVGDDFWKIIGFENEVKSFIKSGMSVEDSRKKAANRIRNGYPTYSMVPRAVKKLRKWPLIGTFVSFPYEIIRTSYNQFGFIKEDHDAGRIAMRNKRIIGMAIASSAAYAASQVSIMMMGMSGDDDEAIKAQLPEWSRNSQLLYIGYDEDELPIYLDLSSLDPYTYLKKPISALLSGNNEGLKEKSLDAMNEMASPFIGTDIAAGVVLELWSNKKSGGGQVYNPEDDSVNMVKDIVNHVRKGIQPGLLSNIERTVLAISGGVSKSGKEYKVKDESLAWIGYRVGTLNLSQSMIYKGYEMTDKVRMASRVLSRTVGSRDSGSDSDIENAFNTMLSSRKKSFSQMIKYINGSRALGVSDRDIKKSLNAANISNRITRDLMNNSIPKWRMSRSFMDSARDRAIVSTPSLDGKDEIISEIKYRKSYIRELMRDYNEQYD